MEGDEAANTGHTESKHATPTPPASEIIDGVERFFPLGTVCQECGYALYGCVPDTCPECGAVTVDLAAGGCVRAMTPEERARAETVVWRVPRRIVLTNLTTLSGGTGIAFLVCLVGLVIIPLFRASSGPAGYGGAAIAASWRAVALFVAFAAVYAGSAVWNAWRTTRQRPGGLVEDLASDRVEEYCYDITHAMRVRAAGKSFLLLRLSGGIIGLSPRGLAMLGDETADHVGSRVRFGYLPRSGTIVSVRADGEPVRITDRDDVMVRWWWRGTPEPLYTLPKADQFVTRAKGAPPLFADPGSRAVRG